MGSAAPFSAPRPGRASAHLRAALSAGKLQQRHAARRSARRNASDLFGIDDHEEDESSGQAEPSTAMTADTSLGDDQGQGGEREGSHQERRFSAIARSRLVDAGVADSRASDQWLADVRAAVSLEELAKVLLATVARGHGSLAGVLVDAARAWQASRVEGAAREFTTLGSVKQALVSASTALVPPAQATLNAHRASLNLWLPIYLLNLDRPRSPQQRQLASERLALIERGLRVCTAAKG